MTEISLFAQLAPCDVTRVAMAVIERPVAEGSVVFYEGQKGDHVYFVRQGKVKVSRYTPGGREQIINVFAAGSAFGLVAAVDQGYYPATATALEPSLVWALPVQALRRLVEEIPTLALALMQQVGSRVRMFQERLYEHDFLDKQSRLACLLTAMARTTGRRTERGVRVAYGLTHTDLAAMIGSTRETVSRTLHGFQRRGLLRVGTSGIEVPDVDALESAVRPH